MGGQEAWQREGRAGIKPRKKSKAEQRMLEPPISILFVDNTKDGMLARRLSGEEKRLAGSTSYRVRIVESAGMPLSRLLPSTNPWGAGDCGRLDCVTCNQGDEKIQDCKKRSILYQSQCQICQVDGQPREDGQGLYIGESSRSMYERA